MSLRTQRPVAASAKLPARFRNYVNFVHSFMLSLPRSSRFNFFFVLSLPSTPFNPLNLSFFFFFFFLSLNDQKNQKKTKKTKKSTTPYPALHPILLPLPTHTNTRRKANRLTSRIQHLPEHFRNIGAITPNDELETIARDESDIRG